MKQTHIIILLAATLAWGCVNLELLQEMQPWDTDTETGATPDTEWGPDSEVRSVVPPEGDASLPVGDGEAPVPVPDELDTAAPVLAGDCLEQEVALEVGCAISGVNSVLVRIGTDEPAEMSVITCPAECAVLDKGWSQEHMVLVWGDGVQEATLALELIDVNGNGTPWEGTVSAGEGTPVAISGVLADPVGEEPLQEYVEITNFGSEELDLSGWMIDDNGDANGDLLPGGSVLPPGMTARIVQAGFQGGDGSTLFALDSSIGTSGLKNSESETVELYNGAGALVSRYAPGGLSPKEGTAIIKIHFAAPEAASGIWKYDE